jgi:hypothetical protein
VSSQFEFVHNENIKLFRRQLAETTDPEKQRMLLRLLAHEEANSEHPQQSADQPSNLDSRKRQMG